VLLQAVASEKQMTPPDDPRRSKTPRGVPIPATDQDQPAPEKQFAHTKPRTPPRGQPVIHEQEMRLTYPTPEERDRRRSDSAGRMLGSGRPKSQAESWEDMHTPPQTDAECWRAIKQVGLDLKELSDDIAEQRTAFVSMLTNTLNQLLEQKNVIVTSQVKVQETGALTTIHDRSELEAMKRRIMWKWLGGTLAVAFASLIGALIHKYL